jgi:hypothetical protein
MQTISFRDLFDHIGTGRMTFSKRAEALSGADVELRGYPAAGLGLLGQLEELGACHSERHNVVGGKCHGRLPGA